MSAVWGCVVVVQLAAQACVRLRPELNDSSVVIMDGVPPQERVFAMNARARAMGIQQAMTRVEVETFGQVHVLVRSDFEERAAEKLLIQAMGEFSPRFESSVRGGDWECVVDLAGTERLLGDSHDIAERIVQSVAWSGFSAFCCMAGNVDAGLSLARHGAWKRFVVPANGSGRTNAVRVVAQGAEAKALATLPLAVLRLEVESVEKFGVWGIHTLGELAALPENGLVARLGQAGKQIRLRARGELPHLLEPDEEAFQLVELTELDEPVDTLEPLLFVLNPMLERLILRAQERAWAIASLTIELRLEMEQNRELSSEYCLPHTSSPASAPGCCGVDPLAFVRTVQPAIPTIERGLLLKMVQLDLQAHPAPGAVRQVRITAEAGHSSRIQMGLFAPQVPEPTRFEDTHARLVATVGEANVGRVRLLDTHAADGFCLERFVLPEAVAPMTPSRVAKPVTAIRRMRPAKEIRVWLERAEIVSFLMEGRRFDVVQRYGPWRSSGNWWNSAVWSCDLWDLTVKNDAKELMVCVVKHDLVQDQWDLEAIYD